MVVSGYRKSFTQHLEVSYFPADSDAVFHEECHLGRVSLYEWLLLSYDLFSEKYATEFWRKPMKTPKISLCVSWKRCARETYGKSENDQLNKLYERWKFQRGWASSRDGPGGFRRIHSYMNLAIEGRKGRKGADEDDKQLIFSS
jgi:hypothetical protein